MSNGSTPDNERAAAERLAAELRAFTDHEAEQLEALAAELAALRNTVPAPAFDRDALWDRIAQRLGPNPAGQDS